MIRTESQYYRGHVVRSCRAGEQSSWMVMDGFHCIWEAVKLLFEWGGDVMEGGGFGDYMGSCVLNHLVLME